MVLPKFHTKYNDLFETVLGFDGDQNVWWQYVTKFRKNMRRNQALEGTPRAINARVPAEQLAPVQGTPEQMPSEPPPELPDIEVVAEPTGDTVPEGA